jgi:hypothetical protein
MVLAGLPEVRVVVVVQLIVGQQVVGLETFRQLAHLKEIAAVQVLVVRGLAVVVVVLMVLMVLGQTETLRERLLLVEQEVLVKPHLLLVHL